jgi:hypothetical protein
MHLLVSHAASIPVEGRRQVVREEGLLSGSVHALDTRSKLLSILENRLGGLGPHDVAVGRKVPHAVHACGNARLEGEVALACAGEFPVPEGLRAAEELAGECARVFVGNAAARVRGRGLVVCVLVYVCVCLKDCCEHVCLKDCREKKTMQKRTESSISLCACQPSTNSTHARKARPKT